ncbi:anti-sigma factor [Marinobacter sp. NFXS11]|uniref:anti-sigma factor n=1 Tax=Marinobacter sp. NFXS11 TaxID=2818432 RepID=UPI0032DFB086
MRKSPERVEILAAEYVLGSLNGPARLRFEGWMMESGRVRQEVWFWEQQLGALSTAAPAQAPPSRVWSGIQGRLWPEQATATAPAASKAGWFWPGWSLVATAAALLFAVLLLQQPSPGLERPLLAGAIIKAGIGDPLWLLSEAGPGNLLKLRSVAAGSAESGKDYELWVVPEEGEPLSLGVLPAGETHEVALSVEAQSSLTRNRTLAISLEPEGGSPTGGPTGPILHVTKLYKL